MPKVLFHVKKSIPFYPCFDGLFAGAIARMAMPDARLVPALSGRPPELDIEPGEMVYLLDVSYAPPVLKSWEVRGAVLKVLDHHSGAEALLSQFDSVFSVEKSGATLAWECWFPGEEVPQIVRYVEDRDIWRKAFADCDTVHRALGEIFEGLSVELAIEKAISLIQKDEHSIDGLRRVGERVDAEIKHAIDAAVSRAKWRIVAGYDVPFVKTITKREKQAYSDIGHALLACYPEAQFAAVQNGRGLALRSEDSRLDVSLIAQAIGGNGHRNAAGARNGDPLSWF